jgi:hypothetical protein
MIYRCTWVLSVIALTTFIAFTRFQADIENEEIHNSPTFHRLYDTILDGLDAEIRSVLLSDKLTGNRSTSFRLSACDSDYVLYEMHVIHSLPNELSKSSLGLKKTKIIYYDQVWMEWSRIKSTLLVLKISFASAFGLTPFDLSRKLLFLTIPTGCNTLDDTDWSSVWTTKMGPIKNALGNK